MIGPGKYDYECTLVRECTQAEGVAVLILGGERGNGFSVQGSLRMQLSLPDLLEQMARDIRESMGSMS